MLARSRDRGDEVTTAGSAILYDHAIEIEHRLRRDIAEQLHYISPMAGCIRFVGVDVVFPAIDLVGVYKVLIGMEH